MIFNYRYKSMFIPDIALEIYQDNNIRSHLMVVPNILGRSKKKLEFIIRNEIIRFYNLSDKTKIELIRR